jgi:F-type H+-transporting ATPase subunit epsilon
MRPLLHLTIATPTALLVDESAESVRAEDESGSFGLLPGHVDLLTALPASVLRWRAADGGLRYCALSGGVLTVSEGRLVAVACRQGKVGVSLETLEAEVQALRAAEADKERQARVEQLRLHANAVRQLMRFMKPPGGAPAHPALAEQDQP